MKLKNYEFKAVTDSLDNLEQKLLRLNPVFKGSDHQIDTYFKVPSGRLKLREGNIENALIFYERPNVADAKQADILLYKHIPDESLKEILVEVLGVKVVVDKLRKIYFIDNVKFHFDTVAGLGTFIEVEAIDDKGVSAIETLKGLCSNYFDYFGLKKSDLVDKSYSDLILEKTSH